MNKIFQEEESIETLKIPALNDYFKNMSQEFRLKNIDEIISLNK